MLKCIFSHLLVRPVVAASYKFSWCFCDGSLDIWLQLDTTTKLASLHLLNQKTKSSQGIGHGHGIHHSKNIYILKVNAFRTGVNMVVVT